MACGQTYMKVLLAQKLLYPFAMVSIKKQLLLLRFLSFARTHRPLHAHIEYFCFFFSSNAEFAQSVS